MSQTEISPSPCYEQHRLSRALRRGRGKGAPKDVCRKCRQERGFLGSISSIYTIPFSASPKRGITNASSLAGNCVLRLPDERGIGIVVVFLLGVGVCGADSSSGSQITICHILTLMNVSDHNENSQLSSHQLHFSLPLFRSERERERERERESISSSAKLAPTDDVYLPPPELLPSGCSIQRGKLMKPKP